jgi:hypothetical protein
MKPIIQIVFVIIFFLFAANANAQTNKVADQSITPSKELVIQLPGVNNGKILPLIKQKIKAIEGITFNGFCESRQLIFLSTSTNSDDVLELFHEMNLEYAIKQNATTDRAMLECLSQSEIQTSLSIE